MVQAHEEMNPRRCCGDRKDSGSIFLYWKGELTFLLWIKNMIRGILFLHVKGMSRK
jgi:hypothetical protein